MARRAVPWRARLRRLRGAGIWLALAGLFVAGGVSTAGRVVATLRHQRRVAESTREYLRYAARTVGERWLRDEGALHRRVLVASDASPAALDARARILLGAEGLGGDPWLGVFHASDAARAPRVVDGTGAAARADVRAALAVALATAGASDGDVTTADVTVGGAALHVAYARRGGAIAGVTVSRAAWERALGARVLEGVALLPPAFARLEGLSTEGLTDARADTLLAVAVHDARGRLRFATPRAGDSAATATARVAAEGGGALTVRAALPPDVAARLVAAHWHLGEDLAWDVGIPLAMLGCIAAAVVLVRRERQLVRARQEFVASVSHELRTPLAQVRAIAETLRLGRARSDAERERWLGVIDREARRLGDLVENIILYSHLERAEFRVHLEPVDLSALVDDAVRAYEPFAASRRARLALEVAPSLTAPADAHALRQVLVNLLDNALKYGPVGQTITVALARAGSSRARLTVADEGPGVPAADRERVWRPFTRLERAGSTAPGTGLGLAVVRALARQHGGDAWVDAAPGGGAAFVVELPLTGGARGGAEASDAVAAAGVAASMHTGR